MRRRVAVALFFAALLGLGLTIFRDYGISWDEPRQREIGGASARYAAETLAPSLVDSTLRSFPELATFVDRDYAFMLEWLLGISDTRDSFMLRHLLTFLLFVGGVFAVYRLAARRFEDWRVGLLAALCLVLSPRTARSPSHECRSCCSRSLRRTRGDHLRVQGDIGVTSARPPAWQLPVIRRL